jgi:hypothetical protein
MIMDAEFYTAFGRLEGKVDALMTMLNTQTKKQEALERRVAVLETWKARSMGLFAAAAALSGGSLAAYLKTILGGP